MPVNRGEPEVKHLPDNNKNKWGPSMFNCVSVPPRLVYLRQRCSRTRLIQIVFEWEAAWPDKYVIECHEGPYIIARSDRLPWATVYEFLLSAGGQSEGSLTVWYQLVLSRLREEGGSTV